MINTAALSLFWGLLDGHWNRSGEIVSDAIMLSYVKLIYQTNGILLYQILFCIIELVLVF